MAPAKGGCPVKYRIQAGMLAFYMHRLSGLALLFYLILHILSMGHLAQGPEHFNAYMAKYNTPVFKLAEIALFAPVLFHALNGLRIILVDLLDLTHLQKQMFYAVLAATAVGWLVMAFFMFQHADVLQQALGLKKAVSP